MGWEYHHRRRGRDGRFVATDRRRKGQLHLRVTPKQAEIIRTMAIKERMGLTEFMLTTITRYYQLKAQIATQQRKENGYQRRSPRGSPRQRGDFDGSDGD